MTYYWDCGQASVNLYLDRTQENDGILRTLFSRFKPSAVYWRGGRIQGYHFRFNEGRSALERFGVGNAAKLP